MEEDSSRTSVKDQIKVICICSADSELSPSDSGLINSAKTIHDLVTSNNLLSEKNTLFFGPLSEIKRTGKTTIIGFNENAYTKITNNDFFIAYDDLKSKSAITAMIVNRIKGFVTPEDVVHIFIFDHGNEKDFELKSAIDYNMLLRFFLSLRVKGIRVYNDHCKGGLFVEAFSACTELNKVAAKLTSTTPKDNIEKCINYLIITPDIFRIGLYPEEIAESLNAIPTIIARNFQAPERFLDSCFVGECKLFVEFFQSNHENLYACKSISDFQDAARTLLSFNSKYSLEPFGSLEEFDFVLQKLEEVGIQSINEVKILDLYFDSIKKSHKKPINFADLSRHSFLPEMGTIFKTFAQRLSPCKLNLFTKILKSHNVVYEQFEPLSDYKIISTCESAENVYSNSPIPIKGTQKYAGSVGVEALIKELFVESNDGQISIDRIKKSIPPTTMMTPKCVQSSSTSKDSFALLFESSKVPATIEDLLISSGFTVIENPSDWQNEEESEEEDFEEEVDLEQNEEYKALLPYVETVRELFRLYNEHLKTKNLEFDPFSYPYQRFVGESQQMRSILDELDEIHPTAYISLILEPCLGRLLHFMMYNNAKDDEISTVIPECYRKALEFAKAKGYTIL